MYTPPPPDAMQCSCNVRVIFCDTELTDWRLIILFQANGFDQPIFGYITNSARNTENRVCYIIITHSQYMINRIYMYLYMSGY